MVTRRDRHDRSIVIDGVDAVLQHLLGDTGWIPSNGVSVHRQLVACCGDQASHCHARAQVERAAGHLIEVNVQLQRCQLRREHVGHVGRAGTQQPISEIGVVAVEGVDRSVRVSQLAPVE